MAKTEVDELMSIGIDIGQDTFRLVGFDQDGQRVLRKQIKRLGLIATFEKLPRCVAGMEACLSAHFVSRTLRKMGVEPRIIPAIYVKPFNKGRKNDYAGCGIGPMISTAMVAAIGEGEAFDRGRDFAAWVGLVPRQCSTGGRTILGRITKRGSRYPRMLYVQAAKVILMRPHRWPDFRFGEWLARASKRMHRDKLAVALANKLARMAWSILRHETAFDAPRDEVAIGV